MFDSVVQCAVLGIKAKTPHMRDECFITDLHPQPCINSDHIQRNEQVTLSPPFYNRGNRFMQDMYCAIRYQSLGLHRSLSV